MTTGTGVSKFVQAAMNRNRGESVTEPVSNPQEQPTQEQGEAAQQPEQPQAEPETSVEGQERQGHGEGNEPKQPEIDESKVLDFLKSKTGKDIASLDDFMKPSGEAKPEKEYNEETSKFLKYQEKHGGTMKDYLALQKDWKGVDDIDLLREQQSEESGMDLTKEQADSLIKKKYGIDPETDLSDLEENDLLALKVDANKYRKKQIQSQDDILKSLDEPEKPEEQEAQRDSEMVTLSNGRQVLKKDYLEARKKYETERKEAVDGLSEASFKFDFNTNNGKQSLEYKYSYTEEDRQRMLSNTEDTSKLMQKLGFMNEGGKINHSELNEGSLWADKKHRETVLIPRLLSQVFSGGIDSQMKEERNINFDKNRVQAPPAPKKNNIDVNRLPGGMSSAPKFMLNNKK